MKKIICIVGILFFSYTKAQVIKPFEVRQQENLKGGLRMIGNTILNTLPTHVAYNGTETNDMLTMNYIDIDNDANTFSSSAASLSLPNSDCAKIRYAGLYWGGMYDASDASKNQIKFKIPSESSYIDLTADTYLFDNATAMQKFPYHPYMCYKDVTYLLKNQIASGEYIVANVRATETTTQKMSGGNSAGWMLVIIYEDPNETAKNITTFDGYASIDYYLHATDFDIVFSGFRTLPAPLPVKARIGVAAMEGDKQITGDKLYIKKPDNTFVELSDAINPANNFFNSSISYDGAMQSGRRPNSSNTLGWDIDLFSIPNAGNAIIENEQTSATIRAHTTQDKFDIYFTAMEVEIIEPQISLLKTVEDAAGNILTNQSVPPGTTVYYGLEFQNIGNDDATELIISDILPENITFESAIAVEIPTASGITYSITTESEGQTVLKFQIPDTLVALGGNKHKIRFAVTLDSDCDAFGKPCSEIIANKAHSLYKGILNNAIINDAGSYSSLDNCQIGLPESTLFYADLSACPPHQEIREILCGENIRLTAAGGFDAYIWMNGQNETIGTHQSVTVAQGGSYTVLKKTGGCTDRKEIHILDVLQRQSENPLLPHAGTVFTCLETQKSFPQIFLCGTQASVTVSLSEIAHLQDVTLNRYTGNTAIAIDGQCPPDTADWTFEGNQKTVTISTEGIYQLLLGFENGCVADYYFRIHTSPVSPTITTDDIRCQNGTITVENVPAGYEYAVRNTTSDDALTYQTTHKLPVSQAGTYNVYIRKIQRLPEDCVIEIQNITIRKYELAIRELQKQNESCQNANDGSILVEIGDNSAPYQLDLRNHRTGIVQTIGTINESEQTAINQLSPAEYTMTVTDDYGCSVQYQFTINAASSLVFRSESRTRCVDNVSVTQLVVSLDDTSVDVSQLQYSIGNQVQLHTPTIENGVLIIPQNIIPIGETHSLTLHYQGCTFTDLVAFSHTLPLRMQRVFDPTLISAIQVKAYEGDGRYTYYFNGMPQEEPTYYLRSFDEGYTDPLGNAVKTIRVRVEDSSGCYVEAAFEEIFYDIVIPRYFSPDGDGTNDTWQIGNALGYPRMRIRIFDRFGRTITTLRPGNSWDGTFNKANLPAGDYWYELKFNERKDSRIYVGHFTLYR
ncbi:MAG: T9SS type B sorting domain-containing protein [Capnocytophaga sp.]|nr:T9SS type B sorting domain-containing protein [Capnocytophaga sp.]